MKEEEFYREADPLWCQGDIIRDVPHLHLRPPLPLTVIRKEQVKYGTKFAPYEYDSDVSADKLGSTSPPGGFKFAEGEQVLAFCQTAVGMLLSYDCEIEKDDKHRTLALVRPLRLISLEHQKIIRENRNLSFCYLPAYSEILGESYVDFRRITTLHPNFLKDSKRIVSLTKEGVKYIQTLFFRYLTRRDVSPEALDKLSLLPE